MKHLLLAFAILATNFALAQSAQPSQAGQTLAPPLVPLFPIRPKAYFYLNSGEKPQSTAILGEVPNGKISLDTIPLSADCYKLRVYKMKWTERLKDNESAFRSYSTCEPGVDFQVRTAVATQRDRSPKK